MASLLYSSDAAGWQQSSRCHLTTLSGTVVLCTPRCQPGLGLFWCNRCHIGPRMVQDPQTTLSEQGRRGQPPAPPGDDARRGGTGRSEHQDRIPRGQPGGRGLGGPGRSTWRLPRAQLDYRPDLTASNLRRGRRTATLGMMLENVANPYSGAVHRAVDDAAIERGMAVLATSLDEDPVREREVARDHDPATRGRHGHHAHRHRPVVPAPGDRGRAGRGIRGPAADVSSTPTRCWPPTAPARVEQSSISSAWATRASPSSAT